MVENLENYTAGNTDWRKSIRQNNRRTVIIISLFFIIYGGIGTLIDLYLYAGAYAQATLPELIHALVTFQLFPTVTLIMLIIAGASLFISYLFYDRLMLLGTDYYEVKPNGKITTEELRLFNVVEELKIAAGLNYMPRVFIINADYMNAFASGYSEKSAMVAITRGLMNKLNRDELQAVMAHEISHIRHLDIKLTLTASLLANLSIMVLDMFFYNAIFLNPRRQTDSRSRNSIATILLLLRYLLPLISILLLMYLSRTRELMADAGCVQLTRANLPLATALVKIQQDYAQNQANYNAHPTPYDNIRREAYIFDPLQAGIKSMVSVSDLFSTHPSLDKRLAALGFKKNIS